MDSVYELLLMAMYESYIQECGGNAAEHHNDARTSVVIVISLQAILLRSGTH